MKKVLVIGSNGSGKSTFANKLSRKIRLPLIHLDQHYWKPGWQRTSKEEWRTKVTRLLQKDSWIMDGNYQSSLDIRIPASDTIIWLDLNRFVCLWRVLKRKLLQDRVDKLNGCQERVDIHFIKWILWNYPRHDKPEIRRLIAKHKHKQIFVLKSQQNTKNLLDSLSNN
ncbi:MAG: hypothetical protein CMI53_01340 [Parcubacteria group bacterium]|nr:hypothetical protein [Parcubacteria group bacterium]|tara:strand:- start:2277 stop:2780 length:504 start_codon:yes stop_codon:yes gene_type:complete